MHFGFVWQKTYLPLPELMLTGDGTLPLQSLKLVHRAIELPVQVSFVTQEFVGGRTMYSI
jgi:hypothetical protein